MLGAVIFDFDGVIADSEALHLRTFNRLLARFNTEITKEDYYADFLGLTDFECLKLIAARNKLALNDEKIKNLIDEKNQIFNKLAKTKATIIEGVYDFLQMLKGENIPMAICSGALLAEINPILEQTRLQSSFGVIVSADVVKKGKPDPEGFSLALQKLNDISQNTITADECVVIEDSHWGLEAAKAAGMHTIAVTNSYAPEQLMMAEKIVTGLNQLSIEDLQELCA